MQKSDFSYQQPLQSMYLSTISNSKQKRPQTAVRNNLKVDDISGTRSKFLQKPINMRQSFNNRNDDIAKSNCRVLIPTQVNKPNNFMRTDDIDGTKSKTNKFMSTRNTNPLNPVYQIPKVQYYPVEQPKFVRDNMITYDIDGTSTKESFAMRLQRQGKILDTKNQIMQTVQMKKKSHLRKNDNQLILDVSDINLKQSKIKGNRMTNPLDPQYSVPKKDQKGSQLYGNIEGSKPPAPRQKFNNPDFSLQTSDIQGAKTKVNNFLTRPAQQQLKQAKPQSLKRGISSNRNTNPLNPTYKYPGWSENGKVSTFSTQRPKTAHQRFDAFIK